jgi:hypothetical protein
MENISHSNHEVLGKDCHGGLSSFPWHAVTDLLISLSAQASEDCGQIWVGTNAFQVAKIVGSLYQVTLSHTLQLVL